MASPFNPNEPIPNDPFNYERTAAISGPLGPIEVGSGLEITPGGEMIAVGGGPAVTYLTAGPGIYVNANTGSVRIVNTGVLNLAAGNGIGLVRDTNNGTWTITNTAPAVNLGGTVTQVNTGDGLVGGPITTSGTIALSNTGVSAGTYQNATITIDAKGRVTAASPGSAISTISGTSPIVVTPGANAIISINEGSSTTIGALRVCDAINVSCSTIAASSSAVKSAYDVAAAALPCSVLAAQGDLISAAAAGIPVRVPAGADGSFLKVCTACAGTGGLTWDSLTFCEGTVTSVSAGNGLTGGTITTSGTIALDTACVISPTLFTSQGALLTATGPNAPTALGVGSNGQLLSANNLCSEGLEWVTPTPSVPCSAFNVKGDILVATGPASYAALPVGANGSILLSCSACTEGVTWVAPEPIIPAACITGKGALITGSVPGIPSSLPVGANGYVLSANSSCLLGLEWVANSQGDVTSVQANAPLTVDNTDPQNPVLSVDAASLTAAGVVQLNNTVSSTSITEAATANAVKGAYDEGVSANLAALAAQTTANSAQADATQALSDAASAQGTANQAVLDAAAAQSDATQALSDSAAAQGTADQAVLDAAAAQADATQALSDAAGAQSTANQAVINAAAAQGDAAQALTNSAAAQTTANQAVVDAGAAQSDATQALSNAATAQSSANQALLDASSAQDAADLAGLAAQAAQADATQALTDAATAQATASAALPLSGGTLTGPVTFAAGQTIPTSSIQSASTTQEGLVQLNDTVSSTSVTQALTANQGKNLQDQINALAVGSNLTLAGTLDASTGNLVTVTTEGSATGFAIGSPLPSAAAGNDNFFVIATVASFSYTPPGGVSTQVHIGDWFLSNGSAWEFLDVGFQAPYASTTVAGIVELATDLETQDGQDANVVVSPYALQSKVSDSTSTTSSTTIASSTAVKAAYDAGIQGQADAAAAQSSANQALLDAASAQTAANNAQSTADQGVLDAAAAQADANQALLDAAAAQADADQALLDAAAAQSAAGSAIPDSTITAKGDLIAGTGSGTYSALTAGTNGQILYACSAAATGVCWAAAPSGATPATSSTLGTVYGCTDNTGCNVSLGAGALAAFLVGGGGSANVAVGCLSLCAVTEAIGNVGVGFRALSSAVTGSCNTAVGHCALRLSTSSNNVAVGALALCAQTSGANNTGVGSCALRSSVGAQNNTAVGYTAMGGAAVSGNNNTAVGYVAGSFLTTGASNTFVGFRAGCGNSTGGSNVAIGSDALYLASGGSRNVVIGATAYQNGSGTENVAIGAQSLFIATNGGCNVAVGTYALCCLGTGTNNVAVGHTSFGKVATTSTGNVGLGHLAGCGSTAGNQNVAIGCGVQVANLTGSCQLAIGFDATSNWLTGDSTKAIRPGAGIIDCAGSCGTDGQVLMSNGLNAICWGTVSSGSGTVTSITAGTGLTGGTITTSGTLALDTACVIVPSTLAAKGDIITATAASTPTALGVGTNGQVLTANSACASGLAWATPQTSPFITYTTSLISYTNGTPVLVAIWGGGAMQGTVTLDLVGYGGFQPYWDFYLTGDATNGPSGWVQPNFYPPVSDGRSQGTWGVDYPVYPSPNNGLWEIYFNPTADALNPSSFTFFYRMIGGGSPSWQI